MAGNPTFLERFDHARGAVRDVLAQLLPAEDLEDAIRETRAEFAAMEREMPYSDRPDHVMYGSTFSVFQALAIYKAATERRCDVHDIGRAILAAPMRTNPPPMPAELPAKLSEDARESRKSAAPNEFVFDVVAGDSETDWGIDILSCAVCHAFAKHGAMELVPYMCATDDKMSDAAGHGLRRTGTIALGAHHCDFRFKSGGEPARLAEQYPDAIRTGGD